MNEKDIFHVDMSRRIYEGKTIGIALVGKQTKIHRGCALKGNLIKLVKKKLFKKNTHEDSAKLYAICIYLLVKEIRNSIKVLIICNDEDFDIVKRFLLLLLKNLHLNIISISEFRKELGRNVGSLADNYANIYRRKALRPSRFSRGKQLNVVKVNYSIIKQYWEELDKNKVSD